MLSTDICILPQSIVTRNLKLPFPTFQWLVQYVQLFYLYLVWYYLVETSETQNAMCYCAKKMWMFLDLCHWSITNRCLQYKRPITTTVFRLYLVCKSGYHMFCIITMVQHILENWTTIEWLLTRVATVMCSNNVHMR